MQQSFSPASHDIGESGADAAWTIVRQASDAADRLAEDKQAAAFAVDANAALQPVAIGASNAVLTWHPESGWACALPPNDPQRAAIDLYLPVASATAARPMTVGHLGQSLDGFIATHTGES